MNFTGRGVTHKKDSVSEGGPFHFNRMRADVCALLKADRLLRRRRGHPHRRIQRDTRPSMNLVTCTYGERHHVLLLSGKKEILERASRSAQSLKAPPPASQPLLDVHHSMEREGKVGSLGDGSRFVQ